jgi:thiosulfate/3-mercaptopyruvate sulfurtransferase
MEVKYPKTLLLLCFFFSALFARAQKEPNWTKEQLMDPAALNAVLKEGKDLPLIISVGPGATIPHSVGIGMANDAANLDKLKNFLAAYPKNEAIVLYCGCCPFGHCPNVRPAISLLQQLKFTNYKLLDLPTNLKKDWIDKGYVVKGE